MSLSRIYQLVNLFKINPLSSINIFCNPNKIRVGHSRFHPNSTLRHNMCHQTIHQHIEDPSYTKVLRYKTTYHISDPCHISLYCAQITPIWHDICVRFLKLQGQFHHYWQSNIFFRNTVTNSAFLFHTFTSTIIL